MSFRKLSLGIVASSFIWSSISLSTKAARGYQDVPQGHWARDSVKELVDMKHLACLFNRGGFCFRYSIEGENF